MSNRDPHDRYYTPPWCVRALLLHVPISGAILEPCAGEGGIAEVLRARGRTVVTSDLVPPEERAQGDLFGPSARSPDTLGDLLDPLHQQHLAALGPYGWAITNPPYNRSAEIARACLGLAPRVALLVRWSWLEETADRSAQPPGGLLYLIDRVIVLGRPRWLGPGGRPVGGTDSVQSCWVVLDRQRGTGCGVHWPPPSLVWCGEEQAKGVVGGGV